MRYETAGGCNAPFTVKTVMMDTKAIIFATGCAMIWAGEASGFRNCEVEDSDAWTAATSYTVGELTFSDTTGLASGTETIYNYSNAYATGGGECHVTYELNGNYVSGSEVFVLSATRSNYSDTCPAAVLATQYPATILHNFQMEHSQDGSAVLNSGDNGDFLADGSWQSGRAVYKTGERCSLF
jgi:hypothetical protein